MKKDDKLFELVKSLSMAEKRYFHILASRHTIGNQNNYEVLFEVIDQMKAYDPADLIDDLHAREYNTRHLSADKNYLYQLILRSLSSYYDGNTVSLQVKEQLHQVEILFAKGLYAQCLGLMKKAKNLARKYDLYPLLIEISLWERKTYRQTGQLNKINLALQEAMDTLALMDNMHAYMQLYYRMLALRKAIPKARSARELEKLQAFISHPFLQNEEIPLSFQARLHYWRIYAMYYRVIGKGEKELEVNRRLLELMDTNAKYAQEFPYEYIEIYGRILHLSLNEPEESFQHTLGYFRDFPSRIRKARRHVEARVMTDAYLIQLARLLKHSKTQEAWTLMADLEASFHQYRKQLSKEALATAEYWCAYVAFVNKQYSEALQRINALLNAYRPQEQGEVMSYAELLNLMIHMQLENYGILPYRVDAALRLLKREKRLHQAEKHLLAMFRKIGLLAQRGKREFKPVWEQCEQALEETFHADVQEQKMLDYLDVRSWLKEKIEA